MSHPTPASITNRKAQPDQAGRTPAFHRQAVGQDRDEDEVVDPQDNFHTDKAARATRTSVSTAPICPFCNAPLLERPGYRPERADHEASNAAATENDPTTKENKAAARDDICVITPPRTS